MAKPNPTAETSLGAPENPENALNPKWAEQMERAASSLAKVAEAILPRMPVAAQQKTQDRASWTTPDQAETYDEMVGKDFLKIDEKTGKPSESKDRFRVTHVYPEFQTVNSNEFKAKFVVEHFRWKKEKGTQSVREIVTSFNMFASDFAKQYREAGVQE